ncbi:LPXTG cell wall anchor domain-containing protein, partial [Clostridium celatum]
ANSGSTTGNSNSGKLPQTGTAGVAGILISGVIALLGGLGLSKKRRK